MLIDNTTRTIGFSADLTHSRCDTAQNSLPLHERSRVTSVGSVRTRLEMHDKWPHLDKSVTFGIHYLGLILFQNCDGNNLNF